MSLHDHNLERALLGSLLRDPASLGRYPIVAELFTDAAHRWLFETIRDRFLSGASMDPELLIAWLVEHDVALKAGGPDVIFKLIDAGGHLDAAALVDQLARFAVKRGALRQMQAATRGLQDPKAEHQEVLAELVSTLTQQLAKSGNLTPITEIAGKVFQTETKRVELQRSRRLMTGIRSFDKVFGGVSRRGASLFIGASGMGKTTVANAFAVSLAASGVRVCVHGTETTEAERTEDMLFGVSRIDPDEWDALVKDGQRDLFLEDRFRQLYDRLMAAAHYLSTLPITISSKVGGTVESFCARLRALRMAKQVHVAVVDYIQDFQWSKEIRRGSQVDHVAHVTTMLKDVSGDLGVPLLEFAQRSDEKGGVSPQNARPQMWDCQHSSRAHQDAEEVFGLFRNDYYVETVKDWPQSFGKPDVLEVIRRKVRRGRRGVAELAWDGPCKWVGEPLEMFPPIPRGAR